MNDYREEVKFLLVALERERVARARWDLIWMAVAVVSFALGRCL